MIFLYLFYTFFKIGLFGFDAILDSGSSLEALSME